MLVLLAATAALATAQEAPLPQRVIPQRHLVSAKSGVQRIAAPDGASWVRIVFDPEATRLPSGAAVRVASELDGAEQTLDAAALERTGYTTAYFNGAAVQVSVAGEAVAAVAEIMAGTDHAPPRPASLCAEFDSRTPSEDPRSARWVGISGCTAFLISDRCWASAGHCPLDRRGRAVLEFNVPLSRGGRIVHPPPEDQFFVDTASLRAVDGGFGNDWQIGLAHPNEVTGLSAFEHAGARAFDVVLDLAPPADTQARLVGFGLTAEDLDPSLSQTQLCSTGPLLGLNGTIIEHLADTTPGSSGSPIIDDADGNSVLGIHAFGGCTRSGDGANSGTTFANQGLRSALVELGCI